MKATTRYIGVVGFYFSRTKRSRSRDSRLFRKYISLSAYAQKGSRLIFYSDRSYSRGRGQHVCEGSFSRGRRTTLYDRSIWKHPVKISWGVTMLAVSQGVYFIFSQSVKAFTDVPAVFPICVRCPASLIERAIWCPLRYSRVTDIRENLCVGIAWFEIGWGGRDESNRKMCLQYLLDKAPKKPKLQPGSIGSKYTCFV